MSSSNITLEVSAFASIEAEGLCFDLYFGDSDTPISVSTNLSELVSESLGMYSFPDERCVVYYMSAQEKQNVLQGIKAIREQMREIDTIMKDVEDKIKETNE